MPVGAPKGSRNAFKGTEWSKSLKRAMARFSDKEGDKQVSWRRGLDRVADKVIAAACEGQKDAWQEIANRIEGRPAQSMKVSGDEDNPIHTVNRIERLILNGDSADTDS
jgi:hypothetical protein